MLKIITSGLLVIAASNASAANLNLTEAQEAKANEIGAVASPVAFLSACDSVTGELSAEDAKEYAKASDSDKEAFNAMRAMGTTFCSGMITAVAQTVAMDARYIGPSGQRICLDPRQSVEGILLKMFAVAKEEPKLFHDPNVTTTSFILYSLQKLSDCQTQ